MATRGAKWRIQIFPEEQLRKLTTRRLKGYLHSLHRLHEDYHYDYGSRDSVIHVYKNHLLAKSDPRWVAIHALVKTILSERKHLDKGKLK